MLMGSNCKYQPINISQAVITAPCNYTWETSNYQHNGANYYSAGERRVGREDSGGYEPISCPPLKETCPSNANAATRHQRQQEVLR